MQEGRGRGGGGGPSLTKKVALGNCSVVVSKLPPSALAHPKASERWDAHVYDLDVEGMLLSTFPLLLYLTAYPRSCENTPDMFTDQW